MHIRLKKTMIINYVEELEKLADQIRTNIKLDRDLDIKTTDELLMLNILILISKKTESNEIKPCMKKHFENLYIEGLSKIYITSDELDFDISKNGEIYIGVVDRNIIELNQIGTYIFHDMTLAELLYNRENIRRI